MTQSEALRALRLRQGGPDAADVPEAWLEEGLASALRLYARHRGRVAVAALDGVADEPVYAVPGAVAVLEAHWNIQASPAEPDPFAADTLLFQPERDAGAGLSLWDSPSLLAIWYQKLRAARERFRGEWEAMPAPTGGGLEVRLMPPPTTTGDKVYVVYRAGVEDVNRVPERDIDALLDAAAAVVFESRATRAAVVESVSFGGASLKFGVDKLRDLAAAHRDRALARLAGPAGPVH